MTPCVFIPIKIGNLREKNILEIWRDSPLLAEIRDRDSFESCGSCEHKYICGGCRARAYGYFGDLRAPDPSCKRNASYWESLKGGIHVREFDRVELQRAR